MAISKGIKSVIVCVLVLGLILEQVHVEGKSCCKTTTNRNCYNLCRLRSSRKTCSNACGCKIVSGRTCPRDYPKFNLPAESADEPDAIQYCNLGCMASVCDAMNNDDVFTVEGTKIDMERCSDECDRFCSGSARMASVVAE